MKFQSLLFFLGVSCNFSAFSQETIFSPIEIKPNVDRPHKFTRSFIGNGQRISIIFQNDQEGPEHTIEIFPEPPLIIRNRQANSSCEINDGGIWVRNQVYLSDDEHYLLVSEYSGSSENLVSYDTDTCEPFQRLDVSGLEWTIDGNKLHFQPFDLNKFVLPVN